MTTLGFAAGRGYRSGARRFRYQLSAFLVTVWGALAFQPPSARAPSMPAHAGDSVTLERTKCYGTCAAYAVSIDARGRVRFDFRGRQAIPKDAATIAPATRDSGLVDPAKVAKLLAYIDSSGFFALPSYSESSAECQKAYNTDFPSATVSATYKGKSHSVEHYLGCHAAPAILWTIENMVDSVAESSRFLKGGFGGPFGSVFIGTH